MFGENNYLKKHLIFNMTCLFNIGVMGTRPLVSLYSHNLGAKLTEVGLITAIYSFLPFFLAIKIGKYIDKHGFKISLHFSTLFCFIGLILPFLFPNLIGIYISQVITGIGQTIFIVAGQMMAGANEKDKEKRDASIMRFSLGMAFGSFLGPFIGGFLAEKWGYDISFLSLSVGCFIALLFTFLVVEVKEEEPEDKYYPKVGNTIGLLKDTTFRKIILIGVLILFGKDMYSAFFPLLGVEYGISNSMIGVIVSINALAGMIIRWFLPTLLNKFSRNTVIAGSILFSGICMLCIPFFGTWFLLLFLSFILGLGLGIGQPLSISATIEYLPKQRVGAGLGLRLSANRLTQLLSPVFVGGLAEIVNMKGVFYIVGIILCLGSTQLRGIKTGEE